MAFNQRRPLLERQCLFNSSAGSVIEYIYIPWERIHAHLFVPSKSLKGFLWKFQKWWINFFISLSSRLVGAGMRKRADGSWSSTGWWEGKEDYMLFFSLQYWYLQSSLRYILFCLFWWEVDLLLQWTVAGFPIQSIGVLSFEERLTDLQKWISLRTNFTSYKADTASSKNMRSGPQSWMT